MRHLLDQFNLQPIGSQQFTGPASNELHFRAFGGQIVAQSLLAAGETVNDDRQCHSLHGYFLRPGNTDREMTFTVESVRDGRSFSMRNVKVEQNGNHIFSLMASFHVPEDGAHHTEVMPAVKDPIDLPSFDEQFAGREHVDDMGKWFDRVSSFDIRYAGSSPFDAGYDSGERHRSRIWIRFKEPAPRDQLMHRAIVSYVSDLAILDPILLAHERRWTDGAIIGASLDHSIWFHRDIDASHWLLFDQTSSVAAHNRGLARAHVWTEDGKLVATVAQEALLRPPHTNKPAH